MSRYRIEVDEAACQGSGLCVGVASDYFVLDDSTYKSRPLLPVVDANDEVRDAAECCPMEAIRLVDPDTEQTIV